MEEKQEYYDDIDKVLIDAVAHFTNICIDSDEVLIFMPQYFQRQLIEFMMNTGTAYKGYQIDPQKSEFSSYCGIKILCGYEDQVIISVKDNLVQDIDPIRIQIP